MNDTAPIRLFTFPAAFGLPTAGPFGLKLELALRLLDVPYERVYEGDTGKGPKRKSPWIEDGPVRMGDTELILEHVARTRGRSLDDGRTTEERARGLVLRRMLEEHYHQVFEHELLVSAESLALVEGLVPPAVPRLLVRPFALYFRRVMRKHLFERGIARHAPAEIAAMGRADVDALVTWLGDREWFVGDRPTKADAIAFGLLAVSIRCGLPTPVFEHVRAQPTLVAFVERVLARHFPELASATPGNAPARRPGNGASSRVSATDR